MQTITAKVIPFRTRKLLLCGCDCCQMVYSSEELDSGVSSVCFQIPALPLFLLFEEINFLSFSFVICKKGTLR